MYAFTYDMHVQLQTEAASSDSTKSQTNDKKSSDETEGGAGRHENHQLEVEVMLYRFKQPVAEVAKLLFCQLGIFPVICDKIILSEEALVMRFDLDL